MLVATWAGTENARLGGMEGRPCNTLVQQRLEATGTEKVGMDAESWTSA